MMLKATPLIRIMIIDDHALLLAGLRLVIERQTGMLVVGEATNRADALRIAALTQPNIILLDLDLGEISGMELMPELLTLLPDARIILLTGTRDPAQHRQAIMQGAMGLVLKDRAIDTVLQAIEQVHSGDVWLEGSMIASIFRKRALENGELTGPAALIASLTDRERDVIGLIGEGLRNKQIAERLRISEATVRHHLSSIFSKLHVADRFELVIFAYRHGLVRLKP